MTKLELCDVPPGCTAFRCWVWEPDTNPSWHAVTHVTEAKQKSWQGPACDDNPERWMVAEHLSYSDYHGGTVGKANVQAWCDRFEDSEDDAWAKRIISYGGAQIIIDRAKATEDMLSALHGLAEYSVMCDDTWSQVESETQAETLENSLGDIAAKLGDEAGHPKPSEQWVRDWIACRTDTCDYFRDDSTCFDAEAFAEHVFADESDPPNPYVWDLDEPDLEFTCTTAEERPEGYDKTRMLEFYQDARAVMARAWNRGDRSCELAFSGVLYLLLWQAGLEHWHEAHDTPLPEQLADFNADPFNTLIETSPDQPIEVACFELLASGRMPEVKSWTFHGDLKKGFLVESLDDDEMIQKLALSESEELILSESLTDVYEYLGDNGPRVAELTPRDAVGILARLILNDWKGV